MQGERCSAANAARLACSGGVQRGNCGVVAVVGAEGKTSAMNYYPEFAKLLDQYLSAHDRAGAWLAQRLEVNPATVTRWRNGESRPNRPEIVVQIADLLGVHGHLRQQLLYAAGYGVVAGHREWPAHHGEPIVKTPAAPPVALTPSAHKHSRWLDYPATYRQIEMTTLAQWIQMGASGIMLGLAGSGVSSLLRYFVQRPDLRPRYFFSPQTILPVWIELQPIVEPVSASVYRVFLRGILEMAQRIPDPLPADLLQACHTHLSATDTFVLQTTLFALLEHCQSADIRLVFAWDRIDLLASALRREVGNCLRAIRDGFPETVIYLMGQRYTPTYLDEIYALDGLGRLLSSHIYLVGALNRQDSGFVIEMRTNTAPVQPSAAEIEQFLSLSGGYPTLLKAVIRWWLTQTTPPPPATWLMTLWQEPGIQLRLREIWHCLSASEQEAVRTLITSRDANAIADALGERLAQLGICRPYTQGWQLAGALLARMI